VVAHAHFTVNANGETTVHLDTASKVGLSRGPLLAANAKTPFRSFRVGLA
jgi:hypothetical protein